MIALNPDTRRRLLASARLLESDKEGERRSALEAVLRLLPEGVTVADLLETALSPVVVPFRPIHAAAQHPGSFRDDNMRPWQRVAFDLLADRAELLSEKEREFVRSMMLAKREPSHKQSQWLDDLAERFRCAA